MSQSKLLTFVLILCFITCQPASGQSNKKRSKKKQVDVATLKGRIVQNDRKKFRIDLDELKTTLNQFVELPEPPIPDNWEKLSMEQRKDWVVKFEASDKGKAFLADRKKLADSAATFDLNVEQNGNFVVYDIPHGIYGLRGRTEKQIDGKTYVFEVFGQIQIKEEVEEVLLDPMMVSATRILKTGEKLPTFRVPTFDGKATIVNGLLKDKKVLLNFWSLESPPSLEFAKTIQKTYQQIKNKHNVQLVSVCIGGDAKKALEYVKKNNVLGWHGHADNWQHAVVDSFGVRVIPALYLCNDDGKLLMTHYDFNAAFQTENDLETIVTNAITGKNIPTPVKSANEDQTP